MSRPPKVLVGVLALVGFLLVVTGTATTAANRNEEPRKQVLIKQILQQRRDVDDLDKAVAELRQQVAGARSAVGQASQKQDEVNREQQQLGLEAGTVALRGSGVTVKLADAPHKPGVDNATFDANRIQDSDIQLVVNALFAAGAEAVSVNENRVVAVTPIRAAGGTIVVNYRPVSSPYRIAAIGADSKRFSSSEIAEHFAQWKKKFGLGYSVERSKKLSAPAYSGRVGISLAKPAGEPGDTTSTAG